MKCCAKKDLIAVTVQYKKKRKRKKNLQEQAVFISQQLHNSKPTSVLNKLPLALIGTLADGSTWRR